ncbi:MAG: DUF1846 family protein [Candidatus Absconditabacteria bacterium]|nr:DUF1846 family protein [Candidatus Absconditabacteria bacterium]
MITPSDVILYKKKGFDGQEYIKRQREAIINKLSIFKNGKLYLEIDGKFLQDPHAARTLPGYIIDSQKHIFAPLKEQIEILFCLDANDILTEKEHSINSTNSIIKRVEIELGIKPQIVINNIDIQQDFDKVLEFEQEFQRRNYKVREKYKIIGYPHNTKNILSDNGFGGDDHIPLSNNLILVIGQDKENKNKTSTCLAQIYNDKQIGLESGYAKLSTFPITKLEDSHPINLAYQIAIGDQNILENNNENTKNTENLLEKLGGSKANEINETYSCITNDEIISIASYQEIQRRKDRNPDLENYDKYINIFQEYVQKKGYDLEQKID